MHDLPLRIAAFRSGAINPDPNIRIFGRRAALEGYDGDNGAGELCTAFIVDGAAQLAGEYGIGLCTIRNSNHFLSAAPYVERAAEAGLLPGRDEEIENWCRTLRAMGKAEIPILQYVWYLNDDATVVNWHTSVDTPIRGSALGEAFDHDKVKNAPHTELGIVTDDQLWESLTYFLKAVIPVAEEAGVRMAMHPADPQVPSLAGLARIMRSPVT